MKYKYFLFDWDGSLGNTLPLWFKTFKETFFEYGLAVSNEDIAYKVLGDWQGPAKVGITDLNEFFNKIEKNILDKLSLVELNPGARELLRNIKKDGGKIAVVTTSKRIYVEPAMKNLGIWSEVDVFLGKEDVTKQKPDPESLIKALGMMGGNSDAALMTGDSYKDIEAARSAGMDSALYFPKKYEEFYLQEKQMKLIATYVIEDFDEMEKIL
jgi:HAD superfamily hydrolase (TIGR01509 family)